MLDSGRRVYPERAGFLSARACWPEATGPSQREKTRCGDCFTSRDSHLESLEVVLAELERGQGASWILFP